MIFTDLELNRKVNGSESSSGMINIDNCFSRFRLFMVNLHSLSCDLSFTIDQPFGWNQMGFCLNDDTGFSSKAFDMQIACHPISEVKINSV